VLDCVATGRSQQTATAQEFIRQRLALSAPSSLVLRTKGIAEILAQQIERGMEHLRAAVERNPLDGPSWACLAIVSGLLRDHSNAENSARNSLRCGVQGPVNLVGLTLLQATLEQDKPPEGPFEFAGVPNDPDAIDDLLGRLPPVVPASVIHPHDTPLILFVSCDHRYFLEYAIPLVLSIAAAAIECTVHLHVINPGRGFWPALELVRERVAPLRLIVSSECAHTDQFGPANVYFATIRYCRLFQVLRANSAPVVILDADMIVRRDLTHVLGPADLRSPIGLCRQPDEPIWQEMVAAMGYYEPQPTALAFAGEVARFIAYNLLQHRACWFLDQVAIYVAWRKHRDFTPFQFFKHDDVYDIQHLDSATIWTLDANKNFDSKLKVAQRDLLARYRIPHVQPTAKPRPEIVETRYGKLLIQPDLVTSGHSAQGAAKVDNRHAELLKAFVKEGYTVVDAAAQHGLHVLAFSQWVGQFGHVLAFEHRLPLRQLLSATAALNGLANVECIDDGMPYSRQTLQASGVPESNSLISLDTLVLEACHLIKVHASSHAQQILENARMTIHRHRPILYIEIMTADSEEISLIAFLKGLGYRVYQSATTSPPCLLCMPNEFIGNIRGMSKVP